MVAGARSRARSLVALTAAGDPTEATLALATDQFIVAGPDVTSGYPWFGGWTRDTMTSYEGLFLETGRADEGRQPLLRCDARRGDVGERCRYRDARAQHRRRFVKQGAPAPA